jgi:hypothetical protein
VGYRVGRHGVGETVAITVRRGKTELDLSVRAEQFTARVAGKIAWEWLGLSVKSSRAGLAVSRVRSCGAAAAGAPSRC